LPAPFAYDADALSAGYAARTLTFAVAVVGGAVAVQFLKRRLVLAEAHRRTMAQRDPPTGLRNRRAFDRVLAREIERCALVVFDFDGFKAINDTHGHPVGDAVLRAVAEACEDVVRATYAWAVAPYDTVDPIELFRLADARLLERKRRRSLSAAA
jgi:predicted signal transduction protein with EAL and GGDEF domain